MISALRLLKFIKPYRWWAIWAPLLMLLEVMMDLMQPRMVQRIVDDGIAQMNLNIIVQTGLLMLVLALVGAIGGLGCGVTAETAAVGFAADLREALYRKVQSFSYGNLDELDTGQLITRLTNDVTQVQDAVAMLLRILVRAPLLLIGSLIMAILTSPQLAFLPIVLMPIELVAMIWVVRRATPMYTWVQERLDGLNQVMQENLAGVRVVKAFVRRAFEVKRFKTANDQLTEQSVGAARIVAFMPAFMMLTLNIGVIGVLWFGGIQVTQGGMQVGQIIAFVNYLTTTLFSLMMVSQLVIQLARAEASAKRIQEVLGKIPEVQDRPDARKEFAARGRVQFENVSFRYEGVKESLPESPLDKGGKNGKPSIPQPLTPEGRKKRIFDDFFRRHAVEKSQKSISPSLKGGPAPEALAQVGRGWVKDEGFPVLKGVSFTAEPGQTVAILGTTGAGKSSLVNLIPRFYDTSAGRVLVDGVDVRDLDQAALRRNIGIALQEVVLFSGTIRDNIRYGRPDASEEDVIAAARAAQAHDFIMATPEGYSTQLGQRGVNLSGGQKQRIAIARALLLKPAILILDDSTSAVDVETESKIQDALDELMDQRTSFVIAQRISTVLKADKILVLDDGQIAAEGTHHELIQSSPIYREIYESQLGNGGSSK